MTQKEIAVFILLVFFLLVTAGCASHYKEFVITDHRQGFYTGSFDTVADWRVSPKVGSDMWSKSISKEEEMAITEYGVSFHFAQVPNEGYHGYPSNKVAVKVDSVNIRFSGNNSPPVPLAKKSVTLTPSTGVSFGVITIPNEVAGIEMSFTYSFIDKSSERVIAERSFKINMKRTVSTMVEF